MTNFIYYLNWGGSQQLDEMKRMEEEDEEEEEG